MSPVCLLLILGMLEPASVAQGHGASACDSQNASSCDEVEFLQSRHERKRKLQATACSDVNQDCRATGCCANESFTCYEKDEYWASCRESCSPGINPADPPEHQTPWSCHVVVMCSQQGQDCRGSRCCADEGFLCYEKDQYWASCRESCSPGINPADPPEHQTPWSCNVLSRCSQQGQDCRNTACCEDEGFLCYEKDQYWASCRQSCQPGINPDDPPEHQTPWTCNVIGDGPSPGPSPQKGPFSTGTVGSSLARMYEMRDVLTSQPVLGSAARAVLSSGGAAGGVVSEGQGYGLLVSGAILASLPADHPDYNAVLDLTYEYFLGWRRMCELSNSPSSCQEGNFQCGGGQYPCLPHWKFAADLTTVLETGSAPDGDADALTGMILAVLALEAQGSQAAWLAEVGQWAFDTCRQFYISSTVLSSSGKHRIVKLGACWGGWGEAGQNPSYHAPAVYRLCRDYMKKKAGQYGSSATEGDDLQAEWDKVIMTSYRALWSVQCPSTGLVPNWAKIWEEGDVLKATGGFSGSGTPGQEFGAEAARTMWRVALDYLLFPDAGEARSFLDPVVAHLETKERWTGNWWDNWIDYLNVDPSCIVNQVFGGWSWNWFIAGPTWSSLVCPVDSVQAGRQQQLIDAAGQRLVHQGISDYYGGSWLAISTITLNGDITNAARRIGLVDSD
ncbi:unnamed protein product [Symbiodinium sp. KB8]|nr:unnamed protein product [Symbiodinium sp. KB8]